MLCFIQLRTIVLTIRTRFLQNSTQNKDLQTPQRARTRARPPIITQKRSFFCRKSSSYARFHNFTVHNINTILFFNSIIIITSFQEVVKTMGEPIVPPAFPNCPICSWGAGLTPETLVLKISGVNKPILHPTWPDYNGTYYVDRTARCRWERDGEPRILFDIESCMLFTVEVWPDPENPGQMYWFFHTDTADPRCRAIYYNATSAPNNYTYWGGQCDVSFQIVPNNPLIVSTMNLVPDNPTLWDTWPIDSGCYVVRYCAPKYSTNIKIKVEP